MKRTVIFAAVLGALVFTSASFAGGSTLKGYGGVGGNILHKVATPSGNSPGSTGTLPFTGLDLTLVCVAGALLLTTGIILRRTAGKRS